MRRDDDREGRTCPACQRMTYHPLDIKHKFCPICGVYDDPDIVPEQKFMAGRMLLTAHVGRRWVAWFEHSPRAQGKTKEQAIARLMILHGRQGAFGE